MYFVLICYLLVAATTSHASHLPFNILSEINSNLNNQESRTLGQINQNTRYLIYNNPIKQINQIIHLIHNLTQQTFNETIIEIQHIYNDLIHRQSYVYFDKLTDIIMVIQNKIFQMKNDSMHLSAQQIQRLFTTLNIYSSSISTLVLETSQNQFTPQDTNKFLLSVVSRKITNMFLNYRKNELLPDVIITENTSERINVRIQKLRDKAQFIDKQYQYNSVLNFQLVTLCKYLMESVFDASSFIQRQQLINKYHVIPWSTKILNGLQQRWGIELLYNYQVKQFNNNLFTDEAIELFQLHLYGCDDILQFYLSFFLPFVEASPLSPDYDTHRMQWIERNYKPLLTRFRAVWFIELFTIYKSITLHSTLAAWKHNYKFKNDMLDLAYELFIAHDVYYFQKLILSLCGCIRTWNPKSWINRWDHKIPNSNEESIFKFTEQVQFIVNGTVFGNETWEYC
eukprot:63223_1